MLDLSVLLASPFPFIVHFAAPGLCQFQHTAEPKLFPPIQLIPDHHSHVWCHTCKFLFFGYLYEQLIPASPSYWFSQIIGHSNNLFSNLFHFDVNLLQKGKGFLSFLPAILINLIT